MKTVLLALLRAYKLGISPFLGMNCRFYPSCSSYAAEAISVHGVARGSKLAALRLCKCHPWHPGGVDLVPPSSCDKDVVAHEAALYKFCTPDKTDHGK